jgi:RHS repeat-associated protein
MQAIRDQVRVFIEHVQPYTAPASMTLAVSVTPGSGTLTKVEYFRGTTRIGTVTASPYSYTWTEVPAGSYTLTAKATNSNGGATTSTARTITVEGTAVAGNVYYIHSDHLDTPREITNEQNQTVWKNPPLTEPFGSTPVDDDPDGDGQAFTFNLRFPGQYYDQETGTHYNYYRDNYLPDFGRYGQSDPIGLEGGINTYGYANSNPLSFIDPTGESVPAVGACVIVVSSVYFIYKYYKFVKCVEQCTSCPNDPAGKLGLECKPLKDDGNTNPNYSCKTYCTLDAFAGTRGKGAAGSNNYP